MGKDNEIYVNVSPVEVNKPDVEAKYQKSMADVLEKATCSALTKAKSKGIVTKKPSGKDVNGFQLIPKLKLLKNIGKGDELKLRAEVSFHFAKTVGDKIEGKVIIITEGANVTPSSPPPKNLDGDYKAAVEAATASGMEKVIKKMLS
jgi:hypothetical protein